MAIRLCGWRLRLQEYDDIEAEKEAVESLKKGRK
jgi:hypothetical protein